MSEPKNAINAVQTTLDILAALAELDGAGITELASEVGLTKGTVHNHLSTLRHNGYVIKDENDEYQVGLRFLDLAHHARSRIGIYELAREEVDKLARTTGEMALFTVEERGMGICLYRSRGEESVETFLYIGHRSHLHHTAVGKAILAHLPEERVAEILDERGLPPVTDDTVTDPEALYGELAEIREEDVAYNRSETIQGLAGVGAPILGPDGSVAGAISVIGPTSRMDDDRLRDEIPDLIRRSTNIIEVNATSI